MDYVLYKMEKSVIPGRYLNILLSETARKTIFLE